MENSENILLTKKHWLILIHEQIDQIKQNVLNKLCEKEKNLLVNELEHLEKNFCGNVINLFETIDQMNTSNFTNIYITGDIDKIIKSIKEFKIPYNNIYVISELSYNYAKYTNENIFETNLGMVPINIYDVGVYFRNVFESKINWFENIVSEHKFQSLTESNKKSNAFRTGIYLTPVEMDKQNNMIKFNLMRSSTNFEGSTDNFRSIDEQIVSKVNKIGNEYFLNPFELNHVQAQIYHNVESDNTKSERKAKIKPHTDKTQDMDSNGIIAFCSFYQNYINCDFTNKKEKKTFKSNIDLYDFTYGKNVSVLTRLRFKLKKDVVEDNYVKSFDLLLYANSVFMISLETNRLYTHEIVPSNLFVDKIQTRIGYVIRCSKTKAVYKDGKTWLIDENNNLIKLNEQNKANVDELKDLYFKENMTSEKIVYEGFNFSLNNGDYIEPNL